MNVRTNAIFSQANQGSPVMSQLNNPQPLFAQCSTLILKLSQQVADKNVDKSIQSIYDKALDDFFNKR